MQVEYAAAYPDLYRRHWWWRVRERILLRTISGLVRGRSDARILDVGCGAGLFFDALEPLGHVEGVESNAEAVAASGRWRHRIMPGPLTDSGPQFDVVLLLDVIEHIAEPGPLLRTVARRLAPRGVVVITVPAFQALWTSHDVLNEHVTRYSRRTLRRLIEHHGFAVRSIRYFFPSLVALKGLVRAVEAVTTATPRVPEVPSTLVNGAIQAWLGVEEAVFGWLPFGGSVLAVAELSEGGQRSPSVGSLSQDPLHDDHVAPDAIETGVPLVDPDLTKPVARAQRAGRGVLRK
jgi:SAM-dependent methyltransferase